MAFDNLSIERDGQVAIVTINRPDVLNALDTATLSELHSVLHDLRADESIRAIVITGAGEKSFVAGADITELARQDPSAAREYARAGQRVFDLIEQLGKPVVAAINGYALGGGCELAMACSIRLAADTARLGQPEVNLGVLPGYGGTQRLPRLIGKGRALEMLLTGVSIPASDAERIGLVNRVVPLAELLAEARRLAHMLAKQAPLAVRAILDAVHRGADMPLPSGCDYETTLFGLLASTNDMKEGTRAFLEKRKPAFEGR